MPLLKVLRTTVIKQSTAQSSTLPSSARRSLQPGDYQLAKIETAPLGHVKVSFVDKLTSADGSRSFQTWFLFVDSAVQLPACSVPSEIRLPVKWDAQTNSRFGAKVGNRMCFSSSIWMAMRTINQRFRENFPTDDDYYAHMSRFGDTTVASAHLAALQAVGFKAQYKQNGSLSDIVESLEAGLPCCLGILHHGTLAKPTGGGHWICCGGVSGDRKRFLIFDSWGKVDQSPPYSGPVSDGNGYWLSESILDARWTVSTPDEDGWMMTFFGN